MPWCEECAKYLTPNSMNPDGTCPKCGDRVADQVGGSEAQKPAQVSNPDDPASAEDETAPWHFKLMVVALVVYLGWRFIDIFI